MDTLSPSFITLLVILSIHALVYLAGGLWLLYHRKEQRDRSRLIMGLFVLAVAVCVIIFIGTAIWAPAAKQFEHSMFEPYPCIFSFLVWFMLPIYIAEVKNPNLLTWPKFFLILSPWILLSLAFLTWHALAGFVTLTPLTSVDAILTHIHTPETILRLALGAIFLPYGLLIFIESKNWRETSAPQPWTNILCALSCVFTLTFVFGLLCRIDGLMIAHILVFDAILGIALYMEAYVRIPVPVLPATSISLAAKQLQQIVETGIWQNPNFNRDDYCRLVGTNHQYLSKAVQSLGYSNLADMLNSYRLESLHQALGQYPTQKLTDLIFQAGFRNRDTANRLFQEKYGCTLAAYRKKIGEKQEK